MLLSGELLDRLRCPETQQGLAPADAETLDRICSASGEPVEGALIREDGQRAYPVHGEFPILLLEAAIDLSRLPSLNAPEVRGNPD